jgi:hypothetical protein
MPRNSTNLPATQAPAASALALPDDIRNDLLRAQAEQIATPQRLPGVKIVNGGACLYEFDDNNDTLRTFRGIVLASHPRNVLWDRPFGSEPQRDPATGEEIANSPACVASDGKFGVPRPGFAHAALGQGVVARGVERIECATCPYNQWESKGLLPGFTPGKGKAVTNQRVVYVMVLDDNTDDFTRATPVELILPPTSLPGYDEYLAGLLNRGIPVQTVVTRFGQERVERNGFRWGVATFASEGQVTPELFQAVLEKRANFMAAIQPGAAQPRVEEGSYTTTSSTSGAAGDEEIPF